METEVVEKEKLEREAMSLLEQAKALEITDAESYTAAVNFGLNLRRTLKRISSYWEDIVDAAKVAYDKTRIGRDNMKKPIAEAEALIDSKTTAWDLKQERLRREEQARLDAQARKEAEDAKLAQAVAAEEGGDKNSAATILDQPIIPAKPKVETAAPKVQGQSYRSDYKPKLPLKDETKIPRQYLMPDMVKINAYVRTMKMEANCEWVEVEEVRSPVKRT